MRFLCQSTLMTLLTLFAGVSNRKQSKRVEGKQISQQSNNKTGYSNIQTTKVNSSKNLVQKGGGLTFDVRPKRKQQKRSKLGKEDIFKRQTNLAHSGLHFAYSQLRSPTKILFEWLRCVFEFLRAVEPVIAARAMKPKIPVIHAQRTKSNCRASFIDSSELASFCNEPPQTAADRMGLCTSQSYKHCETNRTAKPRTSTARKQLLFVMRSLRDKKSRPRFA